MSRIAKDPVNIPDGVTVASENNTINFKGFILKVTAAIDVSVPSAIDAHPV